MKTTFPINLPDLGKQSLAEVLLTKSIVISIKTITDWK